MLIFMANSASTPAELVKDGAPSVTGSKPINSNSTSPADAREARGENGLNY
jgi:hypothetical protein